mgnify:CR=1 FL=1
MEIFTNEGGPCFEFGNIGVAGAGNRFLRFRVDRPFALANVSIMDRRLLRPFVLGFLGLSAGVCVYTSRDVGCIKNFEIV